MSFYLYINDFCNEEILHTMANKLSIICDVGPDKEIKSSVELSKILKKKDVLKELSESFCSNGLQFFSCLAQLPFYKNDTSLLYNIYKYEGSHKFAIELPLAPLLGLPNIKPKEELKELVDLLHHFKSKALENPDNKICLQLHRGFGQRDIDVLCTNKEDREVLKKEFDDIVSNSPVLTQWRDNQKEAIKNTHRRLGNLFCTLQMVSFLSIDEQMEYFKKQAPKPHVAFKNRKNNL